MHRNPQLVLSIILFNVTLFSSEGSETKTTREILWSFFVFRADTIRPYRLAPR